MVKAHHAPKGGENIGGRHYKGGQFAPDSGPFGPISMEYRHDAKGAVAHLLKHRQGEAIAALHHPEVGDIDLVWGWEGTAEKDYEDGYGLAKIAKKHPEVLASLQEHLLGMHLVPGRSGPNRKRLESSTHEASVRLEWDGQAKTWLLTAYEKGAGDGTRTISPASRGGNRPPTGSNQG